MEGIAKAKAAGVYKGRPVSIDPAQVQQLKLKAWAVADRRCARHASCGLNMGKVTDMPRWCHRTVPKELYLVLGNTYGAYSCFSGLVGYSVDACG